MEAVAIKNTILAVLAAFGAWIAQALGGCDTAIIALVAVMVIDYVTGLMVALIWHNSPKTASGGASSAAGLKGLLRKFVMLLFVGMAYLLDRVTGTSYIRDTVILFFIANECLSILENGELMGIKYPKFLKSALEVGRDKADAGPVTGAAEQVLDIIDGTNTTDNQTEAAADKPPDASGK